MIKLLRILVLLSSAGLLTACRQSNSEPETASSSSSQQSSSQVSSSHAALSSSVQSGVTLTHNADDKQALLKQTWHFEQFALIALKGELEDSQHLELEIEWQNLTTANQQFANIAEINVHQGQTQLAVIERDDDFADSVGAQANEDFELTYRLSSQTQPLRISITPERGATKTLTVNLN
ncbi:hypothetical protein [Loigolactobacillus binensis]|uniref:DUF5067 domain-containing protein n=1 Tax=Loigolactobacillus binensis TaxID=2559922 RepID=A0ABW3E9Q4_9LACO|nr:hypothetical protein [Loigolactobacillus binensis]